MSLIIFLRPGWPFYHDWHDCHDTWPFELSFSETAEVWKLWRKRIAGVDRERMRWMKWMGDRDGHVGFQHFGWIFTPIQIGNDPVWLAHIFQMGWFNHQQMLAQTLLSPFVKGIEFNWQIKVLLMGKEIRETEVCWVEVFDGSTNCESTPKKKHQQRKPHVKRKVRERNNLSMLSRACGTLSMFYYIL